MGRFGGFRWSVSSDSYPGRLWLIRTVQECLRFPCCTWTGGQTQKCTKRTRTSLPGAFLYIHSRRQRPRSPWSPLHANARPPPLEARRPLSDAGHLFHLSWKRRDQAKRRLNASPSGRRPGMQVPMSSHVGCRLQPSGGFPPICLCGDGCTAAAAIASAAAAAAASTAEVTQLYATKVQGRAANRRLDAWAQGGGAASSAIVHPPAAQRGASNATGQVGGGVGGGVLLTRPSSLWACG